uniref:BHLH domain-containing protein n=1 Tax=Kalanchoe fedtschenkoi TaxID=63787 RepID=A0A7N0RF09_KALFE
MASSEDFETAGICSGGWWNPGRSLFPPCAAPLSDFMWASSVLNGTVEEEQAEMKQAAAAATYSRSDESDDRRSSSAEHLMSSDYTHIFQDVGQKQPHQMADFGLSDWSQNSLLHDYSPNMSIFKTVVDDQKNNNRSSHGLYNLDPKVSQLGLLQENIDASSYAYTSMVQALMGPDHTDMSYGFGSSFVASSTSFMQQQQEAAAASNWPKSMISPSPKQQLNGGAKRGNISAPFWDDSWMGSDEIRTPESSHPLLVPALFEDHKPNNSASNSFNGRSSSTTPPKPDTKDNILPHKLAGFTLLGSKRKINPSGEPYKRPRIETPSSLPTFKVRKEKLGDRITALQQLVSPFGKTDTASVLHEAIEYIKFLHDQVLRTPYMQNGTPTNQHQQMQGEAKNAADEGPKQDLRSRGLCLVPISSTFPVANETTADFWTPTFGGTMTFR